MNKWFVIGCAWLGCAAVVIADILVNKNGEGAGILLVPTILTLFNK